MFSKFESVDWAVHYTDPEKQRSKPSCPWNQVFIYVENIFNIYFIYPPCRILALIIHRASHKSASTYKPMSYSCFSIYNTNTWVIISRPLNTCDSLNTCCCVPSCLAPLFFLFQFSKFINENVGSFWSRS